MDDKQIPEAIAKKRAFEAQISPSLRRCKELLGQIGVALGNVAMDCGSRDDGSGSFERFRPSAKQRQAGASRVQVGSGRRANARPAAGD